jgi:hypothetical protein
MPDGGILQESRDRALAALQRGSEMRQLRDAALDLGRALCATADDNDLWARIHRETGAFRTAQLTAEQSHQLDGVLRLDWARLLNETGYVPPPAAESQANALQIALSEVLTDGPGADIDATRERMRALCKRLVELGEGRPVSRRELRRQIRSGVRTAGKVLVLVGVIAVTGVAAAPLAATLGVPLLLAHVAAGLVAEGARRMVERDLDRGIDPREVDRYFDPADIEALEAAYSTRTVAFEQLVEEWRARVGATPPDRLTAETSEYLDGATKAFYRSWDAAIGAAWYFDIEELFYEVNDRAQRARQQLRQEAPDPELVVDALERFNGLASRLQDSIEDLARAPARDDE